MKAITSAAFGVAVLLGAVGASHAETVETWLSVSRVDVDNHSAKAINVKLDLGGAVSPSRFYITAAAKNSATRQISKAASYVRTITIQSTDGTICSTIVNKPQKASETTTRAIGCRNGAGTARYVQKDINGGIYLEIDYK